MSYFERAGKGRADLFVEGPLLCGKWKLNAYSKSGDLVVNLIATNGPAVERRFNRPITGRAFPAFREFHLNSDCPSARITVTAEPSVEWEVSLDHISSTVQANASNQNEASETMASQPPDFVCVNIREGNRSLNVRSGPGFSHFDIVAGGDRDNCGGAVAGTRYKVISTDPSGELVSGNPIWHEIEFNGSKGWVSEFYVDPC